MKTTESSEPNADDDLDNPESEVELDSLGSFFIHLIDNDYYQDDAEGSQAEDPPVQILCQHKKSIRQTGKLNFLILLLIWILNFL